LNFVKTNGTRLPVAKNWLSTSSSQLGDGKKRSRNMAIVKILDYELFVKAVEEWAGPAVETRLEIGNPEGGWPQIKNKVGVAYFGILLPLEIVTYVFRNMIRAWSQRDVKGGNPGEVILSLWQEYYLLPKPEDFLFRGWLENIPDFRFDHGGFSYTTCSKEITLSISRNFASEDSWSISFNRNLPGYSYQRAELFFNVLASALVKIKEGGPDLTGVVEIVEEGRPPRVPRQAVQS
jgi:hypothetical protein